MGDCYDTPKRRGEELGKPATWPLVSTKDKWAMLPFRIKKVQNSVENRFYRIKVTEITYKVVQNGLVTGKKHM